MPRGNEPTLGQSATATRPLLAALIAYDRASAVAYVLPMVVMQAHRHAPQHRMCDAPRWIVGWPIDVER